MPRKNNYGQFGKRPQSNDDPTPQEPQAKRPATALRFSPQQPSNSFDELGGCEEQQREALMLAIPLKKTELSPILGVKNGVILHGPPGTGKTTFAKALAAELDLPLYFVSATELVAGISGESERRIRELFVELMAEAPAVLVLDDIDGIATKRENAQREMERRIVAQLIASMDELQGKPILVIGTTNRVESLDASLRRSGRFDQEISFGIPDERSRLKILEIITKNKQLGQDVSLQQLARNTPGYVGSDLQTLIRAASSCAFERTFPKILPSPDISIVAVGSNRKEREYEAKCVELENLKTWLQSTNPVDLSHFTAIRIGAEDFAEAIKRVVPSAKREGFATVPDVKWADIGALSSIRSELLWSILYPIQRPECFEVFSINPRPQGILLCGPPGCGKTLLAKAIANETGINFISVKGPELLSMFVGESERAVRTVFQRARDSSPCVIFFDEIDALCPKRSHIETSGSARLVNQLLTEMDGMEMRKQVFLIGATNRPDMVDPAILRPGRFDQILYVDFPNAEDRADILRKITKNGECPRLSPSVDVDVLARNPGLDYFTGADIAALVHEATVIAIRERIDRAEEADCAVSFEHFELAMEKVAPSVVEDDRNRYERLRKKYAKRIDDE